jgi:hypothetical protein
LSVCSIYSKTNTNTAIPDTGVKGRTSGKAPSGKSFATLDERTTRRDERAATTLSLPTKEPTPSIEHSEKVKKNFFKSIFKKKSTLSSEDTNMPLTGKPWPSILALSDADDRIAIPNNKNQEVRRNDKIMVNSSSRKDKVADGWNKFTQVFGWGFKPANYLYALTENRDMAMHYIDMIVSNYQGVTVVRNTKLSCCGWSGSVAGGRK